MLYAIIGQDADGSLERRKQLGTDHRARLRSLQDSGRLVLAGPFPAVDADPGDAGFTGSLIVAEFESAEAARAWADSDPYAEAGVYRAVTVYPFRQVLP